MRVRGVLLVFVAGVLLLAACAWALPPHLDWSHFRGAAEAFASSRLGRPVSIAGPISLSLLPRPVLTAEQLSVGEVAQNGGSFAVQSVRMQVALAPLLSGRIDARALVLRKPVLRLPWPVPPGLLAARPVAWSDGFMARVEDGSVMLGNLTIGGITASLGTDAGGKMSGAGVMTIAQQAWRFAARLGSQNRQGAASFELAVDGARALAGVGMKLSGQLAADGSFDGRITGGGPDLSRLVSAPALSFQARGHLATAGDAVVADDLSLELGGSPARATVRLGLSPTARLDSGSEREPDRSGCLGSEPRARAKRRNPDQPRPLGEGGDIVGRFAEECERRARSARGAGRDFAGIGGLARQCGTPVRGPDHTARRLRWVREFGSAGFADDAPLALRIASAPAVRAAAHNPPCGRSFGAGGDEAWRGCGRKFAGIVRRRRSARVGCHPNRVGARRECEILASTA